jgi:rhodanese-related sulfurtransferase
MKQITVLVISLFFLSGCGNTKQKEQNSEQEQTEIFIKNVDATAFKKLVDAGNGIILDVRTPEEIAGGYISNSSAINLYDEDFEENIGLIAKDKEIYVYCKSGGRSSQAANMLQKKRVQ